MPVLPSACLSQKSLNKVTEKQISTGKLHISGAYIRFFEYYDYMLGLPADKAVPFLFRSVLKNLKSVA